MALRSAYKNRVNPGDSLEYMDSLHAVDALTRGAIPRQTGHRVASKTSEFIENAFEFLKNSVHNTYARHGPGGDPDVVDPVGYKDNFTFGPPRISEYRSSGRFGPTSPSYDGGAPRDRRYPFTNDDQWSYGDSIGLAKGLVERFNRPKTLDDDDETGNWRSGERNNRLVANGGHVKRGSARERSRSRSPRGFGGAVYTIGEDGSAVSYDISTGREFNYNSDRHGYRDRTRSGYPDVDGRGYRSRYPDETRGYGNRSDYESDRPKPGVVYKKSGKLLDDDDGTKLSTTHRRCLFMVILILGFLLISGITAAVALHFLGFFDPKPSWKDGYDVTAVFSKSYKAAFADKNSDIYKNEANSFKTLTESILNNGTEEGGYRMKINDILPGSTKYLFAVELTKKTDASSFNKLLDNGYNLALENHETDLHLLELVVKEKEEYANTDTHTTAEVAETTNLPDLTTWSIEIPTRTTPATVAVCKSLEENKCAKFGYDKVGSENPHNFADLQLLVSNGCYDHALEFICVTSYPPCEDNRQRYPCKQFCKQLVVNCSFPLPCKSYLDDDLNDLCYKSPEPDADEDSDERESSTEYCQSDEFQCGSGICKPNNVKCDGNDDCGDYSDELFCPGYTDIGLDCDFSDNSLCNYTNDEKGHFSWSLNKGKTPSPITGPLADHTWKNDSGLYLYAEASGQYPYSVARIMSTEVTPDEDWCLRFYYHMFGDQIESLKIYQYFANNAVEKEKVLWQRSRNQGDTWIFSAVTLPAGRYQIVFEATRGDGYRGDIAIDDISARRGSCPLSAEGCPDNQFSCANSNCIEMSYVCNSNNDCGDYSDEKKCNCTNLEFQCHFGMCIPLYQRCDNNTQCPDGSDEIGCDSVCSYGRHKCKDGTCILREWLCDHEADCPDNSDEVNCSKCGGDNWQCRDNGCIQRSDVCNGKKDCHDASDEKNCFKLDDDNVVQVTKGSLDNWIPICSYGFKPIYFNELCKLMGYDEATSHGVRNSSGEQFAVLLESSGTINLLQQLPLARYCDGNEVVTIDCLKKECGQQTKDNHVEPHIVHGNDAPIGQWPWQVALFINHTARWLFSCGGTLVSHHHIITAAHCVKLYADPARYKVLLGTTVIYGMAKNVTRVEIGVSHIAKPSEFTTVEWGSDIAVLTLSQYITFSDVISPICLPNLFDEFPITGQCYVSGWGKTDFFNSSSVPANLQEAKMKIWSDEQCSLAYVNYNNKMICAGYSSGYTGNCQGDSGGPLQCRDVHGLWKLYGVFSYFVRGCNVPMQPPVFTRVQKYLTWLDGNLKCKIVCDNKKCLMDESARCNGIDDCGDTSDEFHCNTSLTCDFDNQFMCGYSYSSTIPLAKTWRHLSSGFTTFNGPVTDHTKGDGTGYFMYADPGISYLLSPITTLSAAGCLEFSLHGCLQGFLEFAVVAVPDNVNHPSKVDINNAGYKRIWLPVIDMWQRVRENLPTGRFIVVFRSTSGFVSIDDTKALEGTCATQVTNCADGEVFCDNKCIKSSQVCNYHTQCFQLQDETSCSSKQKLYQCNLENYRDCFFEQGYLDHGDWIWYEPDRLQINGPLDDHTTATDGGHVLFLNTKLLSPGQFATISLPVKVPLVSCLKFYYNMDSTGALVVMVCAESNCVVLLHKHTLTTVGWKEVQLELQTAATVVNIYGYAGLGTDNDKNYIAIDDISINPNICDDLTCRPDQYKCSNGDCILKSLMCDNIDHCGDNSDEDDSLCKDVTKMAPDMFRCDDGTYRQRHLRCDDTPDCPDQSDEINCNSSSCQNNEFNCSNGKCKNLYSMNDGYNDCNDESDETGNCEAYQFTCGNGHCISGFRYCDGYIDCPDASDEPVTGCQCNATFHFKCGDGRCIAKEYDCDGDHIAHCSDERDEDPTRCIFTCTSGSSDIILASQVCDSIPQCPQGQDEIVNCDCPFGYSPCTYGGCVPSNKLCDGHYDCMDHSDEANCVCTDNRQYKCQSGMCLSQSSRCNQIIECDDWSDELNCGNTGSDCPQGYFTCENGVCITNDKKCDGQDNCGDGSDEFNCACDEQTEYQCKKHGTCIPLSWKCDRINDCSDGADEVACDMTCTDDQFLCNSMEYSCISTTARCNSHYDCSDGSDEMLCERLNEQGFVEALRGNEWTIICSTNWYDTWSNDVCKRLGKGKAIESTEVAADRDKYLIIRAQVTNITSPLFTSSLFNDASSCPSGKGLQIKCAEPVCGVPPPRPSALIIGGHISSTNSWPWMAAILHAGKPLCGAVMISSKWLITAAHCFKAQRIDDGKLKHTPHYIKVVMGSTKLSYPSTTGSSSEQDRLELEVETIIIHPSFNVNSNNVLLNDIALVKLKRTVLTDNTDLRYICYPQQTEQLPEKAKCYTAGWGLTDYRNDDQPNQLKRAINQRVTRLNLWTTDDCRNVWSNDVNFTLHLCAGSTALRPTVCHGDSGGPLMCNIGNGIWQVVGVTSFGQSDCGQTSDVIKPVIFTRVSTYSDWITNHMATT